MKRYNYSDALKLFDKDFLSLMEAANAIRYEKNPKKHVTYIVDTNINYTNICSTKCSFCAFYKNENDKESYTLDIDQIEEIAENSAKKGVSTLLIQGGLNSSIPYNYYLDMVHRLTTDFPKLFIHAFSPPEIDLMGKISGKSVKDVLIDLKNNGLRTIPGGGAEILTENVRKKIAPLKIDSDAWLEIMKIAHQLGYRTTATMMFGHIERKEDIINHLMRLREIQDETGGFTAFICWDFKPLNTALQSRKKYIGSTDYLKIIAISRIVLDNFDHIQASWSSQGKKTAQVALYCGADDFGSILIEENVMRLAGHRNRATADEIRRIISDAGFVPFERDPLYNILL